jgi:hypothetical protein
MIEIYIMNKKNGFLLKIYIHFTIDDPKIDKHYHTRPNNKNEMML